LTPPPRRARSQAYGKHGRRLFRHRLNRYVEDHASDRGP
jgi:hypothetical protein